MEDLTVVIPFRGMNAERIEIFEWIYRRYEIVYPECEIIVSDSNSTKPFNRGEARNLGVDKVKTKYVLLSDADSFCEPNHIAEAIRLYESGRPWVIPHDKDSFLFLNRQYSRSVLSNPPDSQFTRADMHRASVATATAYGGIVCVSVDTFNFINGYDERYNGWGYEDTSFRVAMDTVFGEHYRIPGSWAFHIYHDREGLEMGDQAEINHQHFRANHYLGMEDRDLMLEIVKGNRRVRT